MRLTFALAAWLLHGISGEAVSQSAIKPLACVGDLRATATNLGKQLSKNASIVFPSDAQWESLLIRGSSPRVSPAYSVVIQVATEADVRVTVAFASRYGIPFLAVSGTHGWTETLNKLPYGLQINMRKLNSTIVDKGGKTATVGGGTLQYEITRSLFAEGKQTVTGLAECVSAIGPLLGGGHSLLQGQHGYALDNLVSARIVLANGTITEASSNKNPDLFWALRGAGHNFGIVTSFVVKTYDIPAGYQWTVYSLIFKQDKLEALFQLINQFEASYARPAKLALTGVFARIPDIDAEPVVAYTVAYEGTEAQAKQYAAPFQALGPAATTISTNVNYVELYTVTGNNLDSAACVKNHSILGRGVSLPEWDTAGIRKAHGIFANLTADPRFSTSIILLENYGIQGVRAVDPASTALAPEERVHPILTSPIVWYEGVDAQTKKDAHGYSVRIKDALYLGVDANKGKRHAYVNYAIGDESKQEVYGYEKWRLEKLKSLKKAWDPENRFGFYNPIV